MKSRADFEEARNTALYFHPTLARLGDAGEDLEEGALAGAVASNDSDYLSPGNFKIDILEGPKDLGTRGSRDR